jgi:hypothetical protein
VPPAPACAQIEMQRDILYGKLGIIIWQNKDK